MRRRTAGVLAALAVLTTTVPAHSGLPPRKPHVLVFSQTLGFRHISVDHAKEVVADLARDGGFTAQFSEDPKVLSAGTLSRTDVVLWLHNTADDARTSPFTDAQEKAYGRWMLCGGGHVGVHAAVDSYDEKAFPEFVEANGAMLVGHPLTATSIADDQTREDEGWGEPEAKILVKDQASPMTSPWRGRTSFQYRDEYYKLDRDPADQVADYELLLALDSFTDPQAQVTHRVFPGDFDEEAPLAWSGSFRGKNHVFYTNLGHSVATWDDGAFQRHLVNGIRWAADDRTDQRCFARSTARTR